MTDEKQKDFSADDLNLLDDKVDDAAGDEKVASASDAKADDASKSVEVKEESKGGDDSGTLFDDLDDDEDEKPDSSKQRDKKSDKSSDSDDDGEKSEEADESKKKEESKADWKESLIALALKGQEDKISAAKLEKRREALKRELSRYKSQEDYMLAGFAAREKLRSGEYRKAKLPDDATDEEVAAWRKEQGIPDKPEAYEIPKVAGHKWTNEDDPFIESFKTVAHSAAFSQPQMDAAAKWYASTMAEMQDKYLQTTAQLDREDREHARDILRAELGNADFKPSLVLMERLIKDDEVMPDGLGEIILTARYQDNDGNSRRLVNHPKMARMLIDMARDTYGDAAMIGGDARVTMNSRKKEIEDIMSSDIKRYYREGLDKELLEISKKEEASARRKGR